VVKIGAEPETAPPPAQEEEQISNEERVSSEEASADAPPKELSVKKSPDSGVSAKKEPPPAAADPLKKLNERIAALEAQLNEAKGEKQSLAGKVASLEAKLVEVKNASAQKERELNASVDAAREQARVEGKKQGHAEGLQSGHEAGLTQARTEVQGQYREKFSGLVANLEGISAKLEAHFADLTALNQPRMLRLWQEMLKRMLQRETSLAPDAVLKVLSDVLSRVSDKNHVLIYASPEDMELLQDRLQGEFGDVLRGAKHLELKPDTNVDKGSCIVETGLGVYDARWRTQLEQIEVVVEKLFQQLGKPQGQEPPSGKPEEQDA
jgi:flagellar assembly protein FliH